MKKRGFTLIELLAVILILGIIALIAIPTVNNIINESKIGAWKSTANNIVSSYERYYQLCQMKDAESCVPDFGIGVDPATVKAEIGLKGELPDYFIVLKLDDDGNALIEFTAESSIKCTNFDEENQVVTIKDMVCEKYVDEDA